MLDLLCRNPEVKAALICSLVGIIECTTYSGTYDFVQTPPNDTAVEAVTCRFGPEWAEAKRSIDPAYKVTTDTKYYIISLNLTTVMG